MSFKIMVGVPGNRITAGTGARNYSFPTEDAAKDFIAQHWRQFSKDWRAKFLCVVPE